MSEPPRQRGSASAGLAKKICRYTGAVPAAVRADNPTTGFWLAGTHVSIQKPAAQAVAYTDLLWVVHFSLDYIKSRTVIVSETIFSISSSVQHDLYKCGLSN